MNLYLITVGALITFGGLAFAHGRMKAVAYECRRDVVPIVCGLCATSIGLVTLFWTIPNVSGWARIVVVALTALAIIGVLLLIGKCIRVLQK